MSKSYNFVALIGRFFIGVLFLMSGVGKIAAPAATQAGITAAGLPLPEISYFGAIAVEVLGSLLLIFGFRVRAVAAGMAVFTLATALFFHKNFSDQNQMTHFMKNIAIIGGLMQVTAFGGGVFSLDGLRARRVPTSQASVAA